MKYSFFACVVVAIIVAYIQGLYQTLPLVVIVVVVAVASHIYFIIFFSLTNHTRVYGLQLPFLTRQKQKKNVKFKFQSKFLFIHKQIRHIGIVRLKFLLFPPTSIPLFSPVLLPLFQKKEKFFVSDFSLKKFVIFNLLFDFSLYFLWSSVIDNSVWKKILDK